MTQPISATDPYTLFGQWFVEAGKQEVNDPNAMSLATVDKAGRPGLRIVLLKGVDKNGFCFFTNTHSRKGHELGAQAQAALCFHWKSLRRQVRIEGKVEKVSDEEADAYFQTRPRGSQIGAWASMQSDELPSRATLEERVKEFEKKFDGKNVLRPPHWSGYRVVPAVIEFWQDMPFRLHDRVVFTASAGGWEQKRLYP